MKIFKIDPLIKLSSVPIFRIVGTVLPLLAMVLVVVIGVNSELDFEFSYSGFNNALFEVFKVPFAIVAACITALGVIAAVHRSAQITLQIEKTSEQNTFANFFKHRQEFIEHFKEIKSDFPDHIRNHLSEKVMRGYYVDTFPENNVSYFTVEASFGWIDAFDDALIKMCLILKEVKQATKISHALMLYGEYMREELSLRRDLFDMSRIDQVSLQMKNSKKVKVQYWTGAGSEIEICQKLIAKAFARINDYANLLIKLKYLADEFEATRLFATSVYSEFKTLDNHKKLSSDSIPIEKFFRSSENQVDYRESDASEVNNILARVNDDFDRLITNLM